MIVWGGWLTRWPPIDTGARYDPATDSWTPISIVGAPSPRRSHSAVWTGQQMIVWGGYYFGALAGGLLIEGAAGSGGPVVVFGLGGPVGFVMPPGWFVSLGFTVLGSVVPGCDTPGCVASDGVVGLVAAGV